MVSSSVAKMDQPQSYLPRAKSASTLRTTSNPTSTSDHRALPRRAVKQETIKRKSSVPLRSSSTRIMPGPPVNVAVKVSALSRQPSKSLVSIASRAKVDSHVRSNAKVSRAASTSSLPQAIVNEESSKPAHLPLCYTTAYPAKSRPPSKTVTRSAQDPFLVPTLAATSVHRLPYTKSMRVLPKASTIAAPLPLAARRVVSVSTDLSKNHTIRRVPSFPSTYLMAKPDTDQMSRSKAVSSAGSRLRNPAVDPLDTFPSVNIQELNSAQASASSKLGIGSSCLFDDTRPRKAATFSNVKDAKAVEDQSFMPDDRVAGPFLPLQILYLTDHT